MLSFKSFEQAKHRLGDGEITELMNFDDWEKSVDEYMKNERERKLSKRRHEQ